MQQFEQFAHSLKQRATSPTKTESGGLHMYFVTFLTIKIAGLALETI